MQSPGRPHWHERARSCLERLAGLPPRGSHWPSLTSRFQRERKESAVPAQFGRRTAQRLLVETAKGAAAPPWGRAGSCFFLKHAQSSQQPVPCRSHCVEISHLKVPAEVEDIVAKRRQRSEL